MGRHGSGVLYHEDFMKGVVLAGGSGSRLFPLTKITNKHLLPIYDKPMIYYPIQTLVDAGVREILVVTGGRNAGDFLRLLSNGKQFGKIHLDYTYQEGEGGIADALALAEHFADGEKLCVILGDNIIEGSIRGAADEFRAQERGARILLKQVQDAERFGVAEIANGRIVNIEEKPKKPKSNYAVTGFYMFDATVFDKIRTLVPSGRGELEITDVNNAYIGEGTMTFSFLDGWWTDAGTFESLLRASNLVAGSRRPAEVPAEVMEAVTRP
jgi:glucose-1-phosphate thymidylyltransferase